MEHGTRSHDQMVPTIASENDDPVAQQRPMSVERIVEEAQNFEYNPLIPLKYWLRTASTLLKEAKIYQHEGNEQRVYLLLFRHAALVLGHLATHPDARQPTHRQALVRAKKDVQSSLAELEVLKPRLNKQYEAYKQLLQSSDERESSSIKWANDQWPPSSVPILWNGADNINLGGDTRELAVILAQNEIRRRASTRVTMSPSRASDRDEQLYWTEPGIFDWDNTLPNDRLRPDQQTPELRPRKLALPLISGHEQLEKESSSLGGETVISAFHYPQVNRQKRVETTLQDHRPETLQKAWTSKISEVTHTAEYPTNFQDVSMSGNKTSQKTRQDLDLENDIIAKTPTTALAQDLTPSFTFKFSASLENGVLLRTVFLPPSLRIRFLSLALPNTRANLETCGILCGTLISNALFISKLVIPDQKSTSDTCETINEDKLFDYVDGEDLLVLGWIHTHPSQSCFMSSRDLHTHAGYQVMIPESIAIVCAPSKGDWGVFRLTDPPGLSSVLKCTETGLFHPHAENNIYTDALRPGHVYEARGLEYDIVDLRLNR